MWWARLGCLVLLLFLLVFFALLLAHLLDQSEAAHGSWMDHYHSATGMLCCSKQADCVAVQARLLAQTATFATAEVNGVVIHLPVKSVHVSEEAQDYACLYSHEQPLIDGNIRCLFIAAGG